jgi:hypothetical protein
MFEHKGWQRHTEESFTFHCEADVGKLKQQRKDLLCLEVNMIIFERVSCDVGTAVCGFLFKSYHYRRPMYLG